MIVSLFLRKSYITTVAAETYTTSFIACPQRVHASMPMIQYGMSVVMSMVLTICMLGMLAYAVRMICGNMFDAATRRKPGFPSVVL